MAVPPLASERRNFYRLLHLQPDASAEVVRSNFVTLMHKLRLHPDLGGDHWNASHLSEAYATLADPKLRSEYDRELLGSYGVAAIGQGRAQGERSASASGPVAINRRDYYRVLEVQREAPLQVIEASYGALQKRALGAGDSTDLIDEAIEFLRNPERRRRYDELNTSLGNHLDALAALLNTDDYVPCILRFCRFCKTPHGQTKSRGHGECIECQSPLFAPPELPSQSLVAQSQRAIERVERKGSLDLYRYWPSRAVRARLVDLSPMGMRFSSTPAFDAGEVLKIDARDFRAVGKVARRRAGWMENEIGVQFLSVAFKKTVGSFVSTRV